MTVAEGKKLFRARMKHVGKKAKKELQFALAVLELIEPDDGFEEVSKLADKGRKIIDDAAELKKKGSDKRQQAPKNDEALAEKTCVRCGKKFTPRSARVRLCESCAKANISASKKKNRAKSADAMAKEVEGIEQFASELAALD